MTERSSFPGTSSPAATPPAGRATSCGWTAAPESPEVTALTEGLAAFAAGEMAAAGAAFTRAAGAIGPGSPLDMAAIRFNLALMAEARGDREEALATLQAIGDATFPGVLEEAIRRLYRTGDERR